MSSPVKNRLAHPRAPKISEAVVKALAAVNETDPLAVDPLYETIDPEALDMLFAPMLDEAHRPGGTIEFTLMDCAVEITVERGDVTVDVEDRIEN